MVYSFVQLRQGAIFVCYQFLLGCLNRRVLRFASLVGIQLGLLDDSLDVNNDFSYFLSQIVIHGYVSVYYVVFLLVFW